MQAFHLWRALGAKPAAILVHFSGSDADGIRPELVEVCRNAGIAIASVAFRPFEDGFPLPQQDAVRAVQYIRHHAGRLGVDPHRLATGGTSAGSGIAMYCAYHADFTDPRSDDPVARESSRVQCVTVSDAQSSYDPRDRARWFGDRFRWKKGTPSWAAIEPGDEQRVRLFAQTAPINLLTADAPPTFLSYMFDQVPLDMAAEMPPDHDWSHTPLFAVPLKEKADRLGVEMRIKFQGHWSTPENLIRQWRDYAAFIAEHL
jgi:hypothetical protein